MSIAKIMFAGLAAWSLPFCLTGCFETGGSKAQEVNLAIWGNYAETEQLKKFSDESGIKVNVSNYTSNEELLAKVQAGSSGIDVAVPSDYMVSIMIKLGLLHDLDAKELPNKSNISSEVLNQSFDPENRYSLPYAWSTAGIAVNRELYKGKIKGWKDIFNNPELKGKISLLDDVREVTAAALKFNGHSVNSKNVAELKQAEATLVAVKPMVKMFRSDTIEALMKKEVAVAHSYSTDALQASRKSGGKIEYILPEDGGTRSIDTLVILKGSKNPEAAHKLINYLLSSAVNVSFVERQMGGPVLKTTRALLPEDIKNNPSLFPTESQLSKFEAIKDVGDATKTYDDLWTHVKTE